jgi:hypothetical protein
MFLAFLTVFGGAGCRSWRYPKRDTIAESPAVNQNSSSSMLQSIANASLHDWDFKRPY